MLFPMSISTADLPLGRVGYSTISDQTRMEILIDGLTHTCKMQFMETDGGYRPIQSWKGVRRSADGNVEEIMWAWYHEVLARGSINFDFLPLTVRDVSCSGHNISGTVCTAQLPNQMQSLKLMRDRLFGEFDFSSLPEALIELNISSNQFQGSCDLTNLPEQLAELYMYENRFTGRIDLGKLPVTLLNLSISNNRFSGEIAFENLPASLLSLHLDACRFSGAFRFESIPPNLDSFAARMNRFSGVAVIAKNVPRFFALSGNADSKIVKLIVR